MKKMHLFAGVIALLLCFTSCHMQKSYRNDVPIREITEDVIEDADTEFKRAEDAYLGAYIPDRSHIREQEIYFASDGNNLDEFGIFYSEHPKELAAELNQYLASTLEENESFYNSYIPEEVPKLRDAEVRTFGNYVAYAILSGKDRKSFFSTVEDELEP